MKYRWIAIALILALGLTACAQKAEVSPTPPAAEHIPASLKTVLTPDTLAEYDFTEQATAYLDYIAAHFPNRDVADDASDHNAFGDWLLAELKACGYDQIQTQDFEEADFPGDSLHGRNYILTIPGRSAA